MHLTVAVDLRHLGNNIGAYFNEVACAIESGAHFTAVQSFSIGGFTLSISRMDS